MQPSSQSEPRSPAIRGISPGHPLVWLGVTLVLLAIGYAWLSTYIGDAAEARNAGAVRKLAPEEAPVPPEIAAPEVEKEPSMSITRDNDENRAEDYLQYEAIEQQILPLLDAADVQFEAGQYVEPPGENAWESYQAILEIDPDESVAIAGLTKIKSHLLSSAEEAIDRGEYAEAENWLVQLDRVQPGDDAQAELRTEISTLIAEQAEQKLRQQAAEALQERIDTALAQAKEAETETPINFNKIKDLYDRVLELESGNEDARDGLERLSDLKLDQVEAWLGLGDLDDARQGLEDATALFPDNKRISALNLALNASLKQQSDEEARRLAEEEALKQQLADEARAREAAESEGAEAAASAEPAETAEAEPEPETPAVSDAGPGPESPDILAQGVTRPRPAPSDGAAGAAVGQGVAAAARENNPAPAPAPAPPSADNRALEEGIRAYYAGDYNRSFELLYPLAQDGVPRAQFRIGIMYQFGRSVAQNRDLAEKWFTTALPELLRQSQQGVAWAQTDLGTAYEFGVALQQDYERAAYWYGRAADQGYAGAQTNLGVLYAQGDGVPYDRAQAIFWLRKAAQQGDRVAIENLNILGVNP